MLNSTLITKTKEKPDNILVDYDLIGGVVSNFACILADWGTAGVHHCGGTPLYAGPRTYEDNFKDLFTFGRFALELFLERKGTVNSSKYSMVHTVCNILYVQSVSEHL